MKRFMWGNFYRSRWSATIILHFGGYSIIGTGRSHRAAKRDARRKLMEVAS